MQCLYHLYIFKMIYLKPIVLNSSRAFLKAPIFEGAMWLNILLQMKPVMYLLLAHIVITHSRSTSNDQ